MKRFSITTLPVAAVTAAALVAAATAGAGAKEQPPDFWNYNPHTGAKTTDHSPGVTPKSLAHVLFPTAAPPKVTTDTNHPDFWNYEQLTGAKITDHSPGLTPDDLARLLFPRIGLAASDLR